MSNYHFSMEDKLMKSCIHNIPVYFICNKCKIEHLQNQLNSLCLKVTRLEDKNNISCDEHRFKMLEIKTDRLDQSRNAHSKSNKQIFDRLEKLEELKQHYCRPFTCPNCNGQGGTFVSSVMYAECHACDGKGIVWG